MECVLIEEKYIKEYIVSKLNEIKNDNIDVIDARYHHNTDYADTPSIIKYGILSLESINNLRIREYSKNLLSTMDDTSSHINGKNGISLAVVGLTDLYKDEFEYDPFDISRVDLLVTSELKASRNSTNYGNEFISYSDINPNMIKSIDIRMLEYLKNIKYINELIKKYNYLREIAIELKRNSLDIPIREMSTKNNILLDKDKLIAEPVLKLKK